MNIAAESGAFPDMMRLLEELGRIGREPGGGVTRLLYTPSWCEAQRLLADRMADAGLEVRYDRAGNLYGRLPGTRPDLPVVLTGSHVDTVRVGGNYDGAAGIAAGIAALSYLKRRFGTPVRTLEVVSFCEEEGSRFPLTYWGSGSIEGRYRIGDGTGIYDAEGVSLDEAMKAAGFGRGGQPDCRRTDIGDYVELHIEQGVVLEAAGRRIGVVESIVGQRRYGITVTGTSNHAGTTPMSYRADALAGAAEMIIKVEEMAWQAGRGLVATVGRIEAWPNTPNVVPGQVRFSLDIRHTESYMLNEFSEAALETFRGIAAVRKLRMEAACWVKTEPVPMDGALAGRIERLCIEANLPCLRMVSGAGHDAQIMAAVSRAAMLFVPSRGGISHAKEEYTEPAHLSEGTAVLTACLHELAYTTGVDG
ncbi:allantoate deiminase [Paenibacillus rhizosphaerae]|uniref:Allantoate deiminase n=1 Tax=Paenibacillus rhizosphaerae TaxID=297318 RepID=A0A839TMI7_9BACL|nr:Zn-dependent hydrolase [Paenibacillus rhizosphaerae]MBB3127995.1 allantoate deiminase [Paenibacillus rhizosphaerae]